MLSEAQVLIDPVLFVRRLLVALGAAAAIWFLLVFVHFYFQARAQEKARRRLRR